MQRWAGNGIGTWGVILCLMAEVALAGAWPRGQGNHFIASALRFSRSESGDTDTSLSYFHEYGLTDKLTVGLDLNGTPEGANKALAFATYPMPDRFGLKTAVGLALGTLNSQPAVRQVLALGRGLADPSGWLAVDGILDVYTQTGAYDWKAEATLGLNRSEGLKIYGQIETGKSYGQLPYARLGGSAAIRLTEGLDLDIGASTSLHNSDPVRLKLGVWRSF